MLKQKLVFDEPVRDAGPNRYDCPIRYVDKELGLRGAWLKYCNWPRWCDCLVRNLCRVTDL